MIDLTKLYRSKIGRNPNPSYAIVDAQSIKTKYRGPARGYDGGKKIKGRKRHISTDTMGNLLYVKVGPANESDTNIGRDVTYQTFRRYSSVLGFCADQGYRGTTKKFVKNDLKLPIDITSKSDKPGFRVVKKRWVVERFFAWLGNFRRFSKDYELRPCVSEQLIIIAASFLILNRIFN